LCIAALLLPPGAVVASEGLEPARGGEGIAPRDFEQHPPCPTVLGVTSSMCWLLSETAAVSLAKRGTLRIADPALAFPGRHAELGVADVSPIGLVGVASVRQANLEGKMEGELADIALRVQNNGTTDVFFTVVGHDHVLRSSHVVIRNGKPTPAPLGAARPARIEERMAPRNLRVLDTDGDVTIAHGKRRATIVAAGAPAWDLKCIPAPTGRVTGCLPRAVKTAATCTDSGCVLVANAAYVQNAHPSTVTYTLVVAFQWSSAAP
jgi:hypothetical protein